MNKRMKYIFYILMVLTTGLLQAQDLPKVQLQTDTTQIRIGEQIRLSVKAQADTLSFVDFPELSTLGDLEVVRSTSLDTVQDKPFRKLQKSYYITQWDSGNYVVPPINIKINDSTFVTDSLRIKILPVQVDTTKQGLYYFKPPINIEGKTAGKIASTNYSWWWLLLLLPVLALAYYFLHKRQKEIAERKILSPYKIAQKSLQKLSQDKLWLQNKVDKHYLQLTDILKEYLENELDIPAKEQISNELLLELKKYHFENGAFFDADLLKRLEETLKRADLAKFAKLTPKTEDIDLDFNIIKYIIGYAHEIVQKISNEKAAKIEQLEISKRRKKRVVIIIGVLIAMAIALVGGVGYYYINKMELTDTIKENISEAEWVYNEYGSSPALGLTTPHILHSVDISAILDTLPKTEKQFIDEISIYSEQNLVKKYVILVGNIVFKLQIPDRVDITKLSMESMLEQFKARNINLQKADIENGMRYFGDFVTDHKIIGKNLNVQFDSHFYQTDTGVKFVLGMYLQGNKDNEALIEKVIQSAELVK